MPRFIFVSTEPKLLPMTIPASPFFNALSPKNKSGRFVPMLTKKSPMIKEGISKSSEMLTIESRNIAELKNMPAIKKSNISTYLNFWEKITIC